MLHPVIVFPNLRRAPNESAVCTDFGAARGQGWLVAWSEPEKKNLPLFFVI
jgi:hypothetical protein